MLTQQLSDPQVYTDIQGLTELKARARSNSRAALDTVAQQFESIFIQMMLKSMRQASLGEGIFDNQQSGVYRDMYDQQLAVELGNQGGVGIAEMLVQQLQDSVRDSGKAADGMQPNRLPERLPTSFKLQEAIKMENSVAEKVAKSGAVEPFEFEAGSPSDFVRTLWPQAERAAAELGVSPEALLAQAALETGWGRAVIHHGDGRSSHNLFNIKADHRWDGEHVLKQTLEYRDGIAIKVRDGFRAYGSYEESFRDYVAFIRENPRYRKALGVADNPQAYVEELQRAGYATDPKYAEKINGIMNGEVMKHEVTALKNSTGQTLS